MAAGQGAAPTGTQGRNASLSIEFVVKPREDLFLEGNVQRLRRVTSGDPYPCQMQKTQAFSCLFRHYAKHNGLRKEDLVFYFVDELLPDETPESVHLMPHDEIIVERRQQVAEEVDSVVASDDSPFSEQFRTLLETHVHSDVVFVVGDEGEEKRAHKAILCARSEYFLAMFSFGSGSTTSRVEIPQHSPSTFGRMLEWVYTDSVQDIGSIASQELIALLTLANEFLMNDLRLLCEKSASRKIDFDSIGKFLLLSSRFNAVELREACQLFVQDNR